MWGMKGFPITDAELGRWVLAAEDICFKNPVLSYMFRLGVYIIYDVLSLLIVVCFCLLCLLVIQDLCYCELVVSSAHAAHSFVLNIHIEHILSLLSR